jgi:periplasmic protein TonB
MSYRALLFCPDEKTARTVTQVLTELDFSVETSAEPFAAVKKLTSEHFDALVVDGDNQQNATLLFKTARNSGSNQNSLAVAIVEGQSGVAKAFQIGANLVLTKPINVEQSKGTIRVARGLLRKTEAAKGSAAPSASDRGFGTSFGETKPVSIPAPPASKPASLTTPPSGPAVAAPTALFEVEKEPTPQPEPAEAALLESMHDPIASKPQTDAVSTTPISKPSSWQPVSQPMAQPMATALSHANEALGKTSRSHSSAETIFSHSASGAATAAAPAREVSEIEEELVLEEKPRSSNVAAAQPAQARSSRTGLIAAIIVIAVAAGGYVAWTRLRLPLAPIQNHKASTPAPPATPTTSASNSVTEPYSAVVTASPLPRTSAVTPSEVPSTTKKAVTSISVSDTSKPAPSAPKADVLVVNSDNPKPAPVPASTEADAEPVPAPSMVSSGSDATAVSGLVEMPASVPKPAPHTLRISQGVSQGLLVKKVAPSYPQRALAMRIQGAVELLATISKDGNVTDVKLLSGDTMLARSAMDAVKQWKYKPYYLDDKPLEIQTQITVNFKAPQE